jgi:RNA recognition motif-containing protein
MLCQSRNGAQLLGRPMRVAPEVKRVVPRAAGDAGDAASDGVAAAAAAPAAASLRPEGATRAYVTGLAYDADMPALEAALREAFAACGEKGVTRVKLGCDRNTSAFRGYAHLDFADTASLDAAVARSGALVLGRVVRVTHAQEKARPAAAVGVAAFGAAPKRVTRPPAKGKGKGKGGGKGGMVKVRDMSRFE